MLTRGRTAVRSRCGSQGVRGCEKGMSKLGFVRNEKKTHRIKYAPALSEAGIVLVQLLLFVTSSPIPHRPFPTVPLIRPLWSILNQLRPSELTPVQDEPPQLAI